MALGGGTFIAQNKVLPGTYINVVSAVSASRELSDRGIAAIGVTGGWGKTGEIFEVTSEDLQKNSLSVFGYSYDSEELKNLRELFAHARIVYCYRLDGGGVKAQNTYAVAKYPGTKGNSIKTVITVNADDDGKYDVATVYGTRTVDTQKGVASAAELVSNDWADFKAGASLSATAGESMTGGTDSDVTGEAHQAFLDALESYSFNALGCVSAESTIKALYANYCKRLRDEMGKKFQVVVQGYAADYEGVVNVKNTVTDSGATGAELVYWVTGVIAGTNVNASASNALYDGEYSVNTQFTQSQLETAIKNGEFAFHKVGADVRVLTDINSLVTTSDTKGDIFKKNQTIRVVDQIANDIAVIFNDNYLGTVPNDSAGRAALKNDIVDHHNSLQRIRAIEGFDDGNITVERGSDATSVVVTDEVTVINSMEKLYMTVTVS